MVCTCGSSTHATAWRSLGIPYASRYLLQKQACSCITHDETSTPVMVLTLQSQGDPTADASCAGFTSVPQTAYRAWRRPSMTRLHPFRFGVIGEHMPSADAWAMTARQAEQLGYSTLFIRDHFIPEPFGDQFAP